MHNCIGLFDFQTASHDTEQRLGKERLGKERLGKNSETSMAKCT